MSYVLNRVTTADTYTTALTLQCAGAVRVDIDVEQAAVTYQLGDGWPAAIWRPETSLSPSFRSLDQRADAVRVRSRQPGIPATVTITAHPPAELAGA